ncbi:glycoside hydrolase family 2 [Chitinophaga agrisoli]|uniref:Glycoside hydrolase family 2 n=2 Tax=Chitinophaga agrisoli TaxID=2607653 RepID=A0A5B2VQK6_9BACT|nr:glycoside hydrolase family 2 [Chitinophaga agrisoli]
MPDEPDIREALEKMEKKEPTWPVAITALNQHTLQTPWSKDVTPAAVWAEYPRPQMVRSEWTNLNGMWDYAITDSAARSFKKPDGKILVPFPLESTLSGVKKLLLPDQKLWYSRNIALSQKKTGKRYHLHFGAVDCDAMVMLNGKTIGSHRGGYQQFSFDITDALQKGDNRLVVAVLDPTDKGNSPKGKQTLNPQGIMYTPSSGIWQTVWMEELPAIAVNHLKLTPDIDKEALQVIVDAPAGTEVILTASSAGTIVSTAKGAAGTAILLPVKEARLWSPADPFLYDLRVQLLQDGKPVDEVQSYFGMRKIEIKKDGTGQERIFLNGQYTFNLGVLDQGFWPDGLYTAPTDKALKWDIATIKDMGFNTIRKHIKIEPARWYYWCDKLGMLVWQDMPYAANLSDEAKARFEKENEENIQQLYNYPSIVCWVLFNEGWFRYDQQRLTTWMKKMDPSRLVNGHSGENYDRNAPPDLSKKWINSDMTDIHDYPGPNIAPPLAGKARVLGEWGGVRVPTPGHQWNTAKNWGYAESEAAQFADKYKFLVKHLKLFETEGLSAAIYTQPFDVEIEENGLITYDRKVCKIPVEQIRDINNLILRAPADTAAGSKTSRAE